MLRALLSQFVCLVVFSPVRCEIQRREKLPSSPPPKKKKKWQQLSASVAHNRCNRSWCSDEAPGQCDVYNTKEKKNDSDTWLELQPRRRTCENADKYLIMYMEKSFCARCHRPGIPQSLPRLQANLIRHYKLQGHSVFAHFHTQTPDIR